jgi:hypothetical protein
LGSNGRGFYISAQGNDSNDGLTPATPLLTLDRLKTMATAERNKLLGGGCFVRMRRGDTFVTPSTKLNGGYGQDFQHPLVFEDYWDTADGPDPGTRPLLKNASSNTILRLVGGTTITSHLVVRRLHFKDNEANVDSATSGIYSTVGAHHVMFDDCVIEGFATNIAWDGLKQSDSDANNYYVTIHRCAIIDSTGKAPLNTPTPHVQGVHSSRGSHFLLSQNFFHRNGYHDSAFTKGTQFNHSNYWNFGLTLATAWGNHLYDGSSHGLGMRGGGLSAYNLIAQHATCCSMIIHGGTICRNVYVATRDIPNSLELGTLGGFFTGTPIAGSGLFEHNICVHSTQAASPRGFQLGSYGLVPGEGHSVRYMEIVERNNTYYQVGPTHWGGNIAERHLRRGNLQVSSNALINFSANSGVTSWSFLNSDHNAYQSETPQYIKGVSNVSTLAQWRTVTGQDNNSIEPIVELFQPDYGINDYAQALGWESHDALILAHRSRPPGVWESRHGAEGAWALFADVYRPINLSSYDSSPWGYYGAVDYRDAIPISYMFDGPANVRVGEPAEFTVQPSAPVTETLAMSAAPAGGSFFPSSLSWSGDNTTRTFHFVAASKGPITIALLRAGEVVALKSITAHAGSILMKRKTQRQDGNLSSGYA